VYQSVASGGESVYCKLSAPANGIPDVEKFYYTSDIATLKVHENGYLGCRQSELELVKAKEDRNEFK